MNSSTTNANALWYVTLAGLAGVVGVAVGAGAVRRSQARSQAATDRIGRPAVRQELSRRGRIPQQPTTEHAWHDRIPGGFPDGTGAESI